MALSYYQLLLYISFENKSTGLNKNIFSFRQEWGLGLCPNCVERKFFTPQCVPNSERSERAVL
jgi:hypothetical protein